MALTRLGEHGPNLCGSGSFVGARFATYVHGPYLLPSSPVRTGQVRHMIETARSRRHFGRFHRTRAGCFGAMVAALCASPIGAQVEIIVHVLDATTDEGIYGARVSANGPSSFALTDVAGLARIELTDGIFESLTADALGYESNTLPLTGSPQGVYIVRLDPSPLELEGFLVSGTRFTRRLQSRRKAYGWAKVLSETTLLNAPDATLEDLLRSKFAIHFGGYSDMGCRMIQRVGQWDVAHFFIDERPVRAAVFEELAPRDIGLLEAYGVGPFPGTLSIHAHTREYVLEMSDRGAPAPYLGTLARLC